MYNKIVDGNEATAVIAYKLSQVLPIYPITPSSPMAEYCSQKKSEGKKNLFNENVKMIEMQSEAGVAGVLHGSLIAHSFASTFTSSQGLLLMIPNMYKISGECLPAVIHVAARSVSSHALSIFCDHSDVMATRMCGFVMICSDNVQQCHDMALVAHTLAMKSTIPVMHFFDGFRTSHEFNKVRMFDDEEIRFVIKDYFSKFKNSFKIKQFGTAQNPDVFFQNREANQNKYSAVKTSLKEIFADIEKISGRKYDFFEYYGPKNPENIIVSMGSSCKTIESYIDKNQNNKSGLIKVRIYRPFEYDEFLSKLPKSVKKITVLDRTKENGAVNPLALDVSYALSKLSNRNITLLSGRYGLGGKDFDLNDVNAIVLNMEGKTPKDNFTVGINDDKNFTSLSPCPFNNQNSSFEIKVFGLGSDGSVSASKSTIKILGEKFDKHVQGYFEYDSKKSGSLTISHLRLSDSPIKEEFLLKNSNVISINNYSFVTRYDCLKGLKKDGIVIINTIFNKDEIGKVLPKSYAQKIKDTNSRLFVINGQKIASMCNLNSKINLIMQTALFKCAGLLTDKEIVNEITKYINDKLAIKGQAVVENNLKSIRMALNEIQLVENSSLIGKEYKKVEITDNKFYQDIMKKIANLDGNSIPVSKFEEDGSAELGTSQFEKRGIASRIPNWIKENCIQCGQCTIACPHSALRSVLTDKENSDKSFADAIGLKDCYFKILLSPLDCTGCGVCAKTCPALKKALTMENASDILDQKLEEYQKSSHISNIKQSLFSPLTAKGLQFNKTLFEFPGACAGCGQTPYLKILTILNGANMMIANATGCTSIYCGTYGSCPYNCDEDGNGILWANSLFEDNAEFGLGLKIGGDFSGQKNKKMWIIGGDGWAYDIGFGGLDHILSSGENVNILVLDNQTYSNTGGQQSKATPTGATVKFAEDGKVLRKKNLGQIALSYKDVYVAQIALGGNFNQAIKAISEAQEYPGVSLIIAYCPCVNQGFNLEEMILETKKAVECGFWPIYRYNPTTHQLTLDGDMDDKAYFDFLKNERRFALTVENGKKDLLEKQKSQAISEYETLKNFTNKKD